VLEIRYRPLSGRRDGRKHPRVFELEQRKVREATTTGWRPTCECAAPAIPAVVLDPFAGTGTSLVVASRLGRHGLGIEMNAEYLGMIKARLRRATRPAASDEKAA
jgi:tRNA G10  N-methylase Trm11